MILECCDKCNTKGERDIVSFSNGKEGFLEEEALQL